MGRLVLYSIIINGMMILTIWEINHLFHGEIVGPRPLDGRGVLLTLGGGVGHVLTFMRTCR